jgi:hypothetical protein
MGGWRKGFRGTRDRPRALPAVGVFIDRSPMPPGLLRKEWRLKTTVHSAHLPGWQMVLDVWKRFGKLELPPVNHFVWNKRNVSRAAFRRAAYPSLLLSVAGLFLVCTVMVGLEDAQVFARSWLPQIAVGYLAMILGIELVGLRLRSWLVRFRAGALFALGLFLVGAVAGSSASMVLYQDFDPMSYVMAPLFWLGLLGLLPALVVGLIGTILLRAVSL